MWLGSYTPYSVPHVLYLLPQSTLNKNTKDKKIKIELQVEIDHFDMEVLLQGPLEPIKSLSYIKITKDSLGQTKEIIQMSNSGPHGPPRR